MDEYMYGIKQTTNSVVNKRILCYIFSQLFFNEQQNFADEKNIFPNKENSVKRHSLFAFLK